MKCWNSARNAQGSKLIIVIVHVGTQFITKIDGFLSFTPPPLNANVLFWAGFFEKSHPLYDKTQGSGAVFSLLYR